MMWPLKAPQEENLPLGSFVGEQKCGTGRNSPLHRAHGDETLAGIVRRKLWNIDEMGSSDPNIERAECETYWHRV